MLTALFAIGMLQANLMGSPRYCYILVASFIGSIALNIAYQIRAGKAQRGLLCLQILFDLLFATIIVQISGGLASSFVWVYLIGILGAALLLPSWGGMIGGSASILLLACITILAGSEASAASLAASRSVVYMLAYIALFALAAYLGTILGLQMKQNKLAQDSIQAMQSLAREATMHQEQVNELVKITRDVAHIDHDINTPLCVITLSLGRLTKKGTDLQDEALGKTSTAINEAICSISQILTKLVPLKNHPLIKQERGDQKHE